MAASAGTLHEKIATSATLTAPASSSQSPYTLYNAPWYVLLDAALCTDDAPTETMVGSCSQHLNMLENIIDMLTGEQTVYTVMAERMNKKPMTSSRVKSLDGRDYAPAIRYGLQAAAAISAICVMS